MSEKDTLRSFVKTLFVEASISEKEPLLNMMIAEFVANPQNPAVAVVAGAKEIMGSERLDAILERFDGSRPEEAGGVRSGATCVSGLER